MPSTTADKLHRGIIKGWVKLPCSEGLGYVVYGCTSRHDFIRTSFVVKHEGNQIETNNSRYTLEN